MNWLHPALVTMGYPALTGALGWACKLQVNRIQRKQKRTESAVELTISIVPRIEVIERRQRRLSKILLRTQLEITKMSVQLEDHQRALQKHGEDSQLLSRELRESIDRLRDTLIKKEK